MDTSAYNEEYDASADVLAVPFERLPWVDRTADALPYWTAVDCIRADEHLATQAPARECVTSNGRWIAWDGWTFSEDATGELWRNRTVADPENER